MDTRGGQSRVPSTTPASCSSVHGSGNLLFGGGTTYAVSGAKALPAGARDPSDMDYIPVKLGTGCGRVDTGRQGADSGGWNPRASMAFDSAKGLLNPVGENNCFLNSAVQVCPRIYTRFCFFGEWTNSRGGVLLLSPSIAEHSY